MRKSLDIVGSKNKYQAIIIVLFSVLFCFQAFPLLGPSFYYMNPIFICKGENKPTNEKYACLKLEDCHIGKS